MNIPSYWDAVWEQGAVRRSFFSFFATLNLGFSLACLLFWSPVSAIVAAPMSWATWSHLASSASRPDLFEYPFVLLWLMPAAGTAAAFIGRQLGFRAFVKFALVFPPLLLCLTIGWWFIFGDRFN